MKISTIVIGMANEKHIWRKVLISVGAVIGTIVLAIGVVITDFTNNTPDYISEVDGVSTGDYIGELADESFKDCGIFDDYEFLLDEHKLNNLLATIVREIKIPAVNLKSIYLDIDEKDNIRVEAPLWALFYRSCAKVDGHLDYDDEQVTLRLTEVKINLLNSKGGIIEKVISEEMVEEIEKNVVEAGVHIDMWKDGNDLCAKMTILDICRTIADCSKSAGGFITAALVGGALTTRSVDLVVNENGLTGVIIHRSLL